MKKVLVILAVVIFMVTASNALAKGKGEKTAEVIEQEKTLVDFLTPTGMLVAEYYKTVAQIKQLENQIESLERHLDRLDAIIKYQQSIEKKVNSDKVEEK